MSKKTKTQYRAFREATRELGCDESEERFQETLRALLKSRRTGEGKAKRKKVSLKSKTKA